MSFNSDFFGGFEDLFNSQENLFQTDVKTILGKNVILNYLCKIEFEIRSFGYSPSANEIAKFYEECKKSGGIIQFFSNPVIKIILQEIQSMPTIRIYLKNRIFDDIENEKIKTLEHIYKNNEQIKDKIDKGINEFSKQKELKRKKINKIMKQNNCTLEEAKEFYEQQQLLEKANQSRKELDQDFFNWLMSLGNTGYTKSKFLSNEIKTQDEVYKKIKDCEQLQKNDKTQADNISNNIEIKLDDKFEENNIDNDTFWSL